MFTPGQYREKALEYGQLVKTASGPNERREFQELEQSFTRLADNAQWCADNQGRTFRALASEIILASVEAQDVLKKEKQCVPQTTLTTKN
jgi:hypothetical protein